MNGGGGWICLDLDLLECVLFTVATLPLVVLRVPVPLSDQEQWVQGKQAEFLIAVEKGAANLRWLLSCD